MKNKGNMEVDEDAKILGSYMPIQTYQVVYEQLLSP
jgi:hypothetical protein